MPGALNDAIALAAIAVASLAHAELLVLLVALPVAVLVHERSRALARHRLLLVVYSGLLLVGVLALSGAFAGALGRHWRLVRESVPPGLAYASVEHLAELALSLAIVPVLVGLGWLLATVWRPVDRDRHAFASTGDVRLVALGASLIAGNPVSPQVYEQPRAAGVQIGKIALGAETERGCRLRGG